MGYDRYRNGNVYDSYNNRIKQAAYGALMDGICVCEGYASLFYRLALECGIECRMIYGTLSGNGHAWNLVQCDDDLFYIVDCTNGVFLLGETGYEGGTLSPNEQYKTAEFKSRYPMAPELFGASMQYSFSEGGTVLTISGDLIDFQGNSPYDLRPWTNSNKSTVKKVIVEEGVTRIGAHAFQWFSALETVILPEGLLSIGDYAFANCTNIKEISLPESLVFLGEDAFSVSLDGVDIVLPAGIRELKPDTFYQAGLTSFRAAENSQLRTIGEDAFREISCHVTLREFVLPDSVEIIGEYAFYKFPIDHIQISPKRQCDPRVCLCGQLVAANHPGRGCNVALQALL